MGAGENRRLLCPAVELRPAILARLQMCGQLAPFRFGKCVAQDHSQAGRVGAAARGWVHRLLQSSTSLASNLCDHGAQPGQNPALGHIDRSDGQTQGGGDFAGIGGIDRCPPERLPGGSLNFAAHLPGGPLEQSLVEFTVPLPAFLADRRRRLVCDQPIEFRPPRLRLASAVCPGSL